MTRVLLAAVALAAFPLDSRRRGDGGPSHRPADAGAEARPQVSAPAGTERAEPRQRGPELPEVLHGAAVLLLQQGGRGRSRPLPDDAARRAAGWTSCASTAAARCGRRTGRPGWIRSTGRPSSASRTAASRRLPAELGPLQVLAAALQVRFRVEVAGRHFDDAVRTAKTMFALARHLGEHPTEVANLVGLWVAHLGLDTLEEMVQQPGCPNLYWALTDLPCPLVDLRKGVQGDRTLVAAELRLLRDDAPMTEAELEDVREPPVRRDRVSPANRRASRPGACGPGCKRGSRTRNGSAPPAAAWSRRVVRRTWSRNSRPCRSSCWTRSATTRSSGTSASSSWPCRSGRSTRSAGGEDAERGRGRAVRRSPAPHRQAPPDAGRAGAADRPAAARRGPAPVRRGARRQAAREAGRHRRAAARRPGHRQAVRLYGRGGDRPPPRQFAPGRGQDAGDATSITR